MSGSCSPPTANYAHGFEWYLAGVLPILHAITCWGLKENTQEGEPYHCCSSFILSTYLFSGNKFTQMHKSPRNQNQILQAMCKPCNNRGAIPHLFHLHVCINKTWFYIRDGVQHLPMCRRGATAISNQVHSLSDWNPGVSLQLRQGLSFQSENRSQNLYSSSTCSFNLPTGHCCSINAKADHT